MSSLSLDGTSVQVSDLVDRLHRAEAESVDLKSRFQQLEARVLQLECGKVAPTPAAKPAAAPAAPAAAKKDDDFDLFGDEEEDSEEKKRITEERIKAYSAKKSNSKLKTQIINK